MFDVARIMAEINTAYQTSLAQFLMVFDAAIKHSERYPLFLVTFFTLELRLLIRSGELTANGYSTVVSFKFSLPVLAMSIRATIFFMLCVQGGSNFESVDEILKCHRSNERYWAVLSCSL